LENCGDCALWIGNTSLGRPKSSIYYLIRLCENTFTSGAIPGLRLCMLVFA
jgi:hypothetical protein